MLYHHLFRGSTSNAIIKRVVWSKKMLKISKIEELMFICLLGSHIRKFSLWCLGVAVMAPLLQRSSPLNPDLQSTNPTPNAPQTASNPIGKSNGKSRRQWPCTSPLRWASSLWIRSSSKSTTSGTPHHFSGRCLAYDSWLHRPEVHCQRTNQTDCAVIDAVPIHKHLHSHHICSLGMDKVSTHKLGMPCMCSDCRGEFPCREIHAVWFLFSECLFRVETFVPNISEMHHHFLFYPHRSPRNQYRCGIHHVPMAIFHIESPRRDDVLYRDLHNWAWPQEEAELLCSVLLILRYAHFTVDSVVVHPSTVQAVPRWISITAQFIQPQQPSQCGTGWAGPRRCGTPQSVASIYQRRKHHLAAHLQIADSPRHCGGDEPAVVAVLFDVLCKDLCRRLHGQYIVSLFVIPIHGRNMEKVVLWRSLHVMDIPIDQNMGVYVQLQFVVLLLQIATKEHSKDSDETWWKEPLCIGLVRIVVGRFWWKKGEKWVSCL